MTLPIQVLHLCARALKCSLFHKSETLPWLSLAPWTTSFLTVLAPFVTGQRKLHTAPIRSVLRLRPVQVLVATGGGYAGYRQYEKHKEKQLQNLGAEVTPKIASDWEVSC